MLPMERIKLNSLRFVTLLAICFSLLANTSFGQVGVAGGMTMLKPFGLRSYYPGLHIGIEIPTNDQATIYLRLTGTLRNSYVDTVRFEAIDFTTSPQIVDVPVKFGSGHINFEGGNRYYLGNGYDDFGFSAYGGTVYQLYTMGVKRKNQAEVDETKYVFKDNSGQAVSMPEKGRILAFALGLNGGVQYNMAASTFYFDVSASYNLFAFASNSLASFYSNYSQLNFAMSIGYRRTLF